MRTLSIWQGMRLVNISTWYHIAAFATGMVFINNDTAERAKQLTITPPCLESCANRTTAWPTVYHLFSKTIFVHLFMAIFGFTGAIFVIIGRNKQKKEQNMHCTNAWL